MYAVILAGGSGTRFWPLSRKKNPKQLMSVFGGKSMLQRTVERVLPLKPKRILVVTNTLQAEESARQLKAYHKECRVDIIEEPVGRNTAPAIGLAASIIARYDPDGLMLVLALLVRQLITAVIALSPLLVLGGLAWWLLARRARRRRLALEAVAEAAEAHYTDTDPGPEPSLVAGAPMDAPVETPTTPEPRP